MKKLSTNIWATELFGKSQLGDTRRTERLVKLAEQMANNIGSSIVQASGDPAAIEGAYRFIRNESFCAEDIAQAGFTALKSKLGMSPEPPYDPDFPVTLQ